MAIVFEAQYAFPMCNKALEGRRINQSNFEFLSGYASTRKTAQCSKSLKSIRRGLEVAVVNTKDFVRTEP